LAGEPFAHVLGHWSFRTLELLVDGRVLIPRPETEIVVEHALSAIRAARSPGRQPVVVADLGTGSGAIALSIAAECSPGSVEVWATDRSTDALDVARANLVVLPFRAATSVRLLEGSWFDALPAPMRGSFDVVVSNPPYIADDDPEVDDSVRQWEPAGALFAGSDGLDAYRVIIAGAASWLTSGGSLVLEIGYRQAGPVGSLAEDAGFVVEVHQDLAGRDRVIVAVRP
jgi:release factor glutamine methyltransferase